MIKKFYFIRHAVTEQDLQDCFQTFDVPLSEKGREQAARVAERLAGLPIEAIVSSSMARAAETAGIISRKIGKPLALTDLFHEVHKPSVIRGKNRQLPEVKQIMAAMREHFSDVTWRHSDEENFADISGRAKAALALLVARPEECLAVVTHGFFLEMCAAHIFLGEAITPATALHIEHVLVSKNTGIALFEYDTGEKPERAWKLISWNDHGHLGDLDLKKHKVNF